MGGSTRQVGALGIHSDNGLTRLRPPSTGARDDLDGGRPDRWGRGMTDPDLPPPPFPPRQHDDQQIERARLVTDFRRRLASTGPVVGHDDLGGLMRTMRSAARLSQRELAARSGVPERTLAKDRVGARRRRAGPR